MRFFSLLFVILAAPAQAEDLTIVTWGGAYEAAQRQAVFAPFTEATGIDLKIARYDGSLTALTTRAAAEGWDVIDMLEPTAISACDAGLLAPLDHTTLTKDTADFGTAKLRPCSLPQNVFATVMAYAPGSRIGYFSNPGVNVGSTATRISGERDNARTIRNTASVLAAFRATAYGNFDLNANALDNSVMLRWTQPSTIGYGTDVSQLRFSTNSYPASTNDGALAYQGTTNIYLHTNVTPHVTHFYSIWVSEDGTNFITPPE